MLQYVVLLHIQANEWSQSNVGNIHFIRRAFTTDHINALSKLHCFLSFFSLQAAGEREFVLCVKALTFDTF